VQRRMMPRGGEFVFTHTSMVRVRCG
jgi:hypothetical protein